MDSLITLEGISKEYKAGSRRIKALSKTDLEIKKGEILGLVGESGSGKSTIANIIVRLIQSDSGKIVFSGSDITELSEKKFRPFRREIQMVFQDPYSSINPKKKIGTLLEECLLIHEKDLAKEERIRRVHDSLDEVGLDSGYAERYSENLSGGERQRVSIALALILRPSLIVLDEPVSALDVSVEAQILNLLLDLRERHALTYLFISHDLNVVSYISDRIAVMYLGHIVEMGSSSDISFKMAHPYTKALFKASEDVTSTLVGEIPKPTDPPPGCPFNTRCPVKREICTQKKPDLREIAPEHYVSCHFPELRRSDENSSNF